MNEKEYDFGSDEFYHFYKNIKSDILFMKNLKSDILFMKNLR